jgi:hypothetical protein
LRVQAPNPVEIEEEIDGSVRTNVQILGMAITRQEVVSLPNIDKLRGSENYGVWKFQMTILFHARKLLGIVNGTITRETCEDEDEWYDKDAQCQSILVGAIDQKLMRRLMTCQTANAMWRCLSTIHEQNATESVQLLHQQFLEFRMKPGTDVVDHISMCEQLANQLTDLGEIVSQ